MLPQRSPERHSVYYSYSVRAAKDIPGPPITERPQFPFEAYNCFSCDAVAIARNVYSLSAAIRSNSIVSHVLGRFDEPRQLPRRCPPRATMRYWLWVWSLLSLNLCKVSQFDPRAPSKTPPAKSGELMLSAHQGLAPGGSS